MSIIFGVPISGQDRKNLGRDMRKDNNRQHDHYVEGYPICHSDMILHKNLSDVNINFTKRRHNNAESQITKGVAK